MLAQEPLLTELAALIREAETDDVLQKYLSDPKNQAKIRARAKLETHLEEHRGVVEDNQLLSKLDDYQFSEPYDYRWWFIPIAQRVLAWPLQLDGLHGPQPFFITWEAQDEPIPHVHDLTQFKRLCICGDVGTQNEHHTNLLLAANERAVDAFLHLGDIYYCGSVKECAGFASFYEHSPLRLCPLFAVPGNHEYIVSTAGSKSYCQDLACPQTARKGHSSLLTSDLF